MKPNDCVKIISPIFETMFEVRSEHIVQKVDEDLICNLNDIEFIKEYEAKDYDKVYDLSRQKHCHKIYAIDKGAQPSKSAILKKLEGQLERAESEKRSAEHSIEWIKKQIQEVSE